MHHLVFVLVHDIPNFKTLIVGKEMPHFSRLTKHFCFQSFICNIQFQLSGVIQQIRILSIPPAKPLREDKQERHCERAHL